MQEVDEDVEDAEVERNGSENIISFLCTMNHTTRFPENESAHDHDYRRRDG